MQPETTTSSTNQATSTNTQATNPSGGCSCPTSDWDMIGNDDCTGFYHCIDGEPSYFQACPAGTLFDASNNACDHAYNVVCACTNLQTTSTSSTSISSTESPETTWVEPWDYFSSSSSSFMWYSFWHYFCMSFLHCFPKKQQHHHINYYINNGDHARHDTSCYYHIVNTPNCEFLSRLVFEIPFP